MFFSLSIEFWVDHGVFFHRLNLSERPPKDGAQEECESHSRTTSPILHYRHCSHYGETPTIVLRVIRKAFCRYIQKTYRRKTSKVHTIANKRANRVQCKEYIREFRGQSVRFGVGGTGRRTETCTWRENIESAGKRNLSFYVSFVPLNFPYRLNASHMTRQGCCSAVSVVELSTVRLTLNPIVIVGSISMYTLRKTYF